MPGMEGISLWKCVSLADPRFIFQNLKTAPEIGSDMTCT